MKKKLEIYELVGSSSQNHSYTIILDEIGGRRRLPIVIGSVEARAIAIGMGGINPKRPQTHDLMISLFSSLNVELVEVIISNFLEGVFYASLVCLREDGEQIEIDSRTSDAIALAVRFNCPIYSTENVLESAGIIFEGQFDDEEEKEILDNIEDALIEITSEVTEGFSKFTPAELQKLLGEAIEKEDYEKAARIRDELEKRK